jgi:SAM-dependent methyltransferase
VAPGSEYFYPITQAEPPLPDGEQMHRVSGNKNPHVFRLAGYTAWRLFDRLLERHFGRGLTTYPRVMDWGVGCGRLARHFANISSVQVTGVDVDADNVAWCKEALPFLHSAAVPLHPPTELRTATFDLVLGISVLTHLRPPEQLEWLAELHRVTKPGGVLLLTTLGQSAFGWLRPDEATIGNWLTDGIRFGHHNDQLDGQIAEKGYYTDTYLHPRSVVAAWSKWFEVVAVERGYLFGHQDVVVLVNK